MKFKQITNHTLVQEQNAWKEALYAWNRSNTELILDSEQLKDCSRYAQDFKETSDFAEVRKTVTDIWFSYKKLYKFLIIFS